MAKRPADAGAATPRYDEPLTAEEEAAIKERHQPRVLVASTRDPKPVWCATCGSLDSPWPCDAARLLLSFAAVEKRVAAALNRAAQPLTAPQRGATQEPQTLGETVND